MQQLIDFTSSGLYCPVANIYIDPWKPVERAIITHAHADHARMGNMLYIAHHNTIPLLRHRLGMYIEAKGLEYGEVMEINGVKITLHPAGHIVGSAQVRLEYKGEVWLITGDYKLENDGIAVPYESIKCDILVTESTFGLPIFKWRSQQEVFEEINQWWQENILAGKNSVLIGYALGKAQRLLCELDRRIGKIYVHSSIENINEILRAHGVPIPTVEIIDHTTDTRKIKGSLIIAPPSSMNMPWLRKFEPVSIAMVAGWMALRSTRRNKNIDRGFVLSEHADWNQLQRTVKNSGAKMVYLTHGYCSSFSRWLEEMGIPSKTVFTHFQGELDELQDVSIGI